MKDVKYCPKCESKKNIEEFYNNRSAYDGLGSYCKVCANKTTVKSRQKNHAINAERIKEQRKLYYTKNKEEILAKNKEYIKANPDKGKKARQKYFNSERGKLISKLCVRQYIDRKKNLPFDYTDNDYDYCYNYFNGKCPICEIELISSNTHVDHWIPISNSECPGSISTNLLLLCDKCNGSGGKWYKPAEEWLHQTRPEQAKEILDRVNDYFSSVKDCKNG